MEYYMKQTYRTVALAAALALGTTVAGDASFFDFFTGNGSAEAQTTQSGLKNDTTGRQSMSSNGQSEHTKGHMAAEPGHVEYCFHHDINVAGHSFSIDSHGQGGINGFSDSTRANADDNEGSMNLNNDNGGKCNTGQIHGVVYLDANKDGIQESNEHGTSGIEIEVTDEEGNVQTVTTDDTGAYTVENVLAGTTTLFVKEDSLPRHRKLENPDQNPIEIAVERGKKVEADPIPYIKKGR